MDGKQEVQNTAGNGEGPSQKSRPNGGGGGGGNGGGKDDVRLTPLHEYFYSSQQEGLTT